MFKSVRILKTQIVRGRNIITQLNCDKTQTEKKLIFQMLTKLIDFSCDQTPKKYLLQNKKRKRKI